MSGGKNDLKTEGLDLITKGLKGALDELRELGAGNEAGTGRGFESVALDGMDLGHEGLVSDFGTFCDRWEWGVRSLINEANAFAEKTDLAAGVYYETEKYVEGGLKILGNGIGGNPYATEEDVLKKDWRQIAESGDPRDYDYSGESFKQAKDEVVQGAKDAGRDVMTSHAVGSIPFTPENMHDAVGVSQEEYDDFLDDKFGPSPEARAQQEAAQGQEGRH